VEDSRTRTGVACVRSKSFFFFFFINDGSRKRKDEVSKKRKKPEMPQRELHSLQKPVSYLTIDDLGHGLANFKLLLDMRESLFLEIVESGSNVCFASIGGNVVQTVGQDHSVLHCIYSTLACTWKHLMEKGTMV